MRFESVTALVARSSGSLRPTVRIGFTNPIKVYRVGLSPDLLAVLLAFDVVVDPPDTTS